MNPKRRPGPVRQLSLRSASPQRYPLKKQLSTDSTFVPDSWTNCNPAPKIKSAPRLAWVERDNNVEIVATKCLESDVTKYKKVLARQTSVEKETLLYTRQELAERLRKAWKERERSKPGLDIFLAQNTSTNHNTCDKNVVVDLTDEINNENGAVKTNFDKAVRNNNVKVVTKSCSEKNANRQNDINGKSDRNTINDAGVEKNTDQKVCVKNSFDDKEKTAYVPSTNAAKCRERGLTQISIVLSPLTKSSDNENSFDEVDVQSEAFEEKPDSKNIVASNDSSNQQFKRFESTNLVNTGIDNTGPRLTTNINLQISEDTQNVKTETNATIAKDYTCLTQGIQDSIKNDSQGCNNVVMVPLSATTKREIFQKQSNKLFTRSVSNINVKPRPPLVRTLSAQSTGNVNKLKFTPTKRRIKTAPIKRKVYQSSGSGVDDIESGPDRAKGRTKKSLTRCRSLEGSEIVTLVSLTSPAESDVEDEIPTKSVAPAGKSIQASPAKNASAKEITIPPKIINLRKSIKSVSFQHSGLTAVRNYSANFPLRRGSVNIANSLINDNITTQPSAEREKRTSVAPTPSSEMKSTKRRLIRMSSAPTNFSEDPIPENSKYREKLSNSMENFEKKEINSSSTSLNNENNTTDICVKNNSFDTDEKLVSDDVSTKGTVYNIDDNSSDDEDSQERKLQSKKEKQCWKMYKKMCDKGIAVSYDTILRGMLTPTEYRLRTKEALETNDTATDNDKAEDLTR